MKKQQLSKLGLGKSRIVALTPATVARIKGGDTVQQGDTLLAPPDTLVHPPDTLNPGDKPVVPPDTLVSPPDTLAPIRDTFVSGR